DRGVPGCVLQEVTLLLLTLRSYSGAEFSGARVSHISHLRQVLTFAPVASMPQPSTPYRQTYWHYVLLPPSFAHGPRPDLTHMVRCGLPQCDGWHDKTSGRRVWPSQG